MITPSAKSDRHWDYKHYSEIFYVLIGCISLVVVLCLLEKNKDVCFFIANTSSWYIWLGFFSIIVAFSIFLISYYTYYQISNIRLAIAGFTFLVAGVFDTLHLLSYSVVPEISGNQMASDLSVIYWMLAKLVTAFGFLFLVSVPEQKKSKLGRGWRLVLSLFVILAGVLLATANPDMANLFYGPGGIKIAGIIVIVVIALIYAYNTYGAVRNFIASADPLNKTMACAFILMLFSQIINMSLLNMHDIRSLLGGVLKLVAFLLFFNIFYIHGIRRPYVLLSKAKEELNEYAYELDRLVDKRTHELRQVNKRLMADLEVARGIQHAMLPAVLPQNEYASFVSGYVPAEKLSGDFYNVIKIDDAHYGVYIGDVSGHGVSAAMLTVFTFQKIMSLMDEIGKEGMTIPSLVLQHLYDSFNAANFSEELYVVMIYGVYNIDTGIFSYASGGLNTSPLRLRPDGSIQELDSEGFAICKLGDIFTPKFSNRQVMLFPGDKLVLYTDGLVETVNKEKKPYSKERLKNFISRHHKWNASNLTRKIIEDVKRYSEHINDDITILTIDVLRPF